MSNIRIADLVLESAMDYAIITLDLHGKVTSWSKGAEIILGWAEDEMLGKPAAIFFTPEHNLLPLLKRHQGLKVVIEWQYQALRYQEAPP